MDTLALEETAGFVGDFLICLSLLYGIDLAVTILLLENINSYGWRIRHSLARPLSAELESLTFVNIILLPSASCGAALLLVRVFHICKFLYCICSRIKDSVVSFLMC
jgi:hypothetical protein